MVEMGPGFNDRVERVGIAGDDRRLKRGGKRSCQYDRLMLQAELWKNCTEDEEGSISERASHTKRGWA